MAECPSPTALADFALGDDDAGDTDEIAAHVGTCSDCAGFVAEVSVCPDGLELGDTPPSEDEGTIDRDALRLEDDHHLTPRLLAAYCDGSLTPVSEALVMDHLTTC